MTFFAELGKKFAMSAAATMGILMVIGIWSSGLERAFTKRTEKMFEDKTKSE